MAKKNKICLTCGEQYYYCSNCHRKDPVWMSEFHAENCKDIFDICTRFNMQMLTKEQAKAELDACDLTNKENFKSFVQRDLENIYKEEPVNRGKRAEMSIFDEIAKPAVHEVVEKYKAL